MSGTPGLTQSRNDTDAYFFDSAGLLQQAAANQSRIDFRNGVGGYLSEGASTQLVPTAAIRDCTNAAWTATNVTPLKDATGIDGAANAASTLTADANNGTCLQAITLGSAERTSSMYVKRKTGTGTVEFTDNGGTNYTDITASLSTADWFRASNTRTQANPDFGFRLGTSGDEIEVDASQVEQKPFVTSPILTETTRDNDVLTGTNLVGPDGTLVLSARSAAGPRVSNGFVVRIDDSTDSTNKVQILRQTDRTVRFAVEGSNAGNVTADSIGTWADDADARMAVSWKQGEKIQISLDRATPVETAWTDLLSAPLSRWFVGSDHNSANPHFDTIAFIEHWPYARFGAELQAA